MTDSQLKKWANSLLEFLNKTNTVAVISHLNPDGDNLGSSMAMVDMLKLLKKEVYFVGNDEVPDDFLFLKYMDQRMEKQELPSKLDLIIFIDCSDLYRIGKDYIDLYNRSKFSINIDHHKSNNKFADLNIIDYNLTSTGELIYLLLKEMDLPISKAAATGLYTAITTDTGSFQYDSVTAKTHNVAAALIELGAEHYKVTQNVYQSRSKEKTDLFIKTVSNIEYYFDDKIAIVETRLKDMKATGAKSSDTEGIIEFVRDIRPVELAILLKEQEDGIKFSLRSKSLIDCTKIAKAFGGGGHVRASGGFIKASLEESKEKIIEQLKETI